MRLRQALRNEIRDTVMEIESINSTIRMNISNYGHDYLDTYHYSTEVLRLRRLRIILLVMETLLKYSLKLWR